MPTSTMTTKYQATIPKLIRDALELRARDSIDFTVDADGRVWLRKAVPADFGELQALQATLLPEWNSTSDDLAYNHL